MTVLLWRYWPPQRTEFDLLLRIISVFVLKLLFQHLLMFWTVVSAPEMIFSVIFEIMVVCFCNLSAKSRVFVEIYKLCGGCDFDERDDKNNDCFDNVLEDGNEDEE